MWNFVVNYSPIIHCIAVLLEHLAFYSCTMLLTANAPLHFTQKVGTSSLAYGGIRLQSFKLYFRQKVHNYSSLSLRSWQLESQPIWKSALASIMMEEKKCLTFVAALLEMRLSILHGLWRRGHDRLLPRQREELRICLSSLHWVQDTCMQLSRRDVYTPCSHITVNLHYFTAQCNNKICTSLIMKEKTLGKKSYCWYN